MFFIDIFEISGNHICILSKISKMSIKMHVDYRIFQKQMVQMHVKYGIFPDISIILN